MAIVVPSRWVLAALVLPSCNGGCNGPEPAPAHAPARAPASVVRDAEFDADRHPATAAMELRLGLRLPERHQRLFQGALPQGAGQPFDETQLGRRFWLAWGPRGLVANDRPLLPAGPVTADDVQPAVKAAIPDWLERAGLTKARAALLIVDAGTDPAVAAMIYDAAAKAADWRLSTLVLGENGQPLELPLPSGSPGP